MGYRKKELDVDFIGSQDAKLTKEEQRSISEFISSKKGIKKKTKIRN